MNSEALGMTFVVILILLQVWYHVRITRVEAGVRWILTHVRIVTQSQEDFGYEKIRALFGIKDPDS